MTSTVAGGPDARRTFLRHVARALPALIAGQLLTMGLDQLGMFDRLNAASVDTHLLLSDARQVHDVVTVTIDDRDYETLFGGVSPLNAERLKSLLQAIHEGKPKVIVVDVDTSGSSFASLATLPCSPAIVWGQAASIENGQIRPTATDWSVSSGCSRALALFPEDSDRVVRRYLRWVKTADGLAQTLPWASVGVVLKPSRTAQAPDVEQRLIFNFAGDRYAISSFRASEVIEGSKGAAWATRGPLRGRIVVVGGTYRAARDRYITPFGERHGLQLVAEAIAAELHGGGIRLANQVTQFGLECLVALAILWANYSLSPTAALWTALGLVPLGAMTISWISFSAVGYWVTSIPVLVGVTLDQVGDHVRHYRLLRVRPPLQVPANDHGNATAARRRRVRRRRRSSRTPNH